MLQSSKLSSRFKKLEKEEIINEQPKKFVFSKSALKPPEPEELPQEDKQDVSDIEDVLKNALTEKIDSIPVWFEYTSARQKELIKSFVENKLSSEDYNLNDVEKDTLIEKLFTSVMGFGPLDYLLARENVDAVFVNGTNSVHIEIGGKVLNTEMKLNEKQVGFILNNIYALSGCKDDKRNNICNYRVKDLFITLIMPELSQCGINISIRKSFVRSIDNILENGMMTREIFDFLVSITDAGKNIVISGDINSGKTTLIDTLINTSLLNRRSALIEETACINSAGDTLMKFTVDKQSPDYCALISNILKMSPEYFIADLNSPVPELSEVSGSIITLRASCVDAAIAKLISGFTGLEKIPEKYAKTKVFTDYDFIVQINKMNDGTRKITSIVELTPARTAALSVKSVAKFVDGEYITEIPQPLTSIRAESLLSESGSMSSRFYHQD